MTITLERIDQKLSDIKEDIKDVKFDVKEVNTKVEELRDKVTMVKTIQDTCPARRNYDIKGDSFKSWFKFNVTTLLALAAIAVSLLGVFK